MEAERGQGLGRAMLEAAENFAEEMRTPAMYLHVAMKKPGAGLSRVHHSSPRLNLN